MKLTIEIDCDNAAFGENFRDTCDEAKWIISRFLEGQRHGAAMKGVTPLSDRNGNRVGKAKFTEGGK